MLLFLLLRWCCGCYSCYFVNAVVAIVGIPNFKCHTSMAVPKELPRVMVREWRGVGGSSRGRRSLVTPLWWRRRCVAARRGRCCAREGKVGSSGRRMSDQRIRRRTRRRWTGYKFLLLLLMLFSPPGWFSVLFFLCSLCLVGDTEARWKVLAASVVAEKT